MTVKLKPLLVCPPTVTVILPVVEPVGTGAVMLVLDQTVGAAVLLLKNFSVLAPCVAPKLVPVTVTLCPTPAGAGAMPEIEGTGTGFGIETCVSKFPFSVPSRSSSAMKFVVVDPAVMLAPAHTKKRPETVSVTLALVLQLIVYFVSVVVIAVVPVAVHNEVPAALFSSSLARGNKVPTFAVFRIHN